MVHNAERRGGRDVALGALIKVLIVAEVVLAPQMLTDVGVVGRCEITHVAPKRSDYQVHALLDTKQKQHKQRHRVCCVRREPCVLASRQPIVDDDDD